MSSLCKLGDDGVCRSCKKTVGNLFITCYFCKDKFHSVNCSIPTSICNSSFHNLYKPLSEKSGVNANRPGNFLFACDTCMTKFEVDQVKNDNDKLQSLQSQVNNLGSGIKDIINMLSNKQGNADIASNLQQISNGLNASSSINKGSVWNRKESSVDKDVNSNVEYPQLDSDKHDTNRINTAMKEKSSVLVIDKFDNESAEKESLNKIENLVTSNKFDIHNSYKNKVGKTVIVCRTDEQRDNLKAEIESQMPSLGVKSAGNLNRTIVVAGFSRNHDEDNILDSLQEQNHCIKDFLAFKSHNGQDLKVDNHISVIAVRPLKRDPGLSQVILRVSFDLRILIKKNGDKLRVGMRRCPVYDRFFL